MELHPTAVKEETGFSAVEMLLCLIIVILITFVGYYIYNTKKNADAAYKAASTAAQVSAPKTTRKAPAVAPPATQAIYLTIKEWGVRMKLPDAIKDAEYSFGRNDAPTSDSFAGLSTVSLTKLAPACGPTATTLGALVRQSVAVHDANVASQAKNGPSFDNEVYTHKLGGYYYEYMHAQASCFDSDSSPAGVYYATVKPDVLLKQAADTLELTPQ